MSGGIFELLWLKIVLDELEVVLVYETPMKLL